MRILQLFLLTIFLSCAKPAEKTPVSSEKKLKTVVILEKKEKLNIQKDTLNFVDYNDDGDYMLLNAKKDQSDFSFINDKNEDRTLLKGDLIEITWKKDTIYISGDGETPELAEWVISVEKLKDGKVSVFRKNYQKKLKYNWSSEESFSKDYLDKLYLIVEYYIANTKNVMIKDAVSKKEQLEYSIEEQTRDGKKYTVVGISIVFEHRVNTLKWLYLDQDNGNKLYGYDLPNDQLVNFE
ncbi:hypothetical protein [Kaistella jeonii]|uniref:Uncharacterized protein n=1 Tax=Kaistella jeonii TaxID=266749 RepID=A0A0C1F705_9FLAO|nr:hypothetical protein [Kaistella jeonii]KIA88982.1 hypothetical protein OA86_07835 [Kaistella jeonii]SFB97497.1 hypothetical protein SAMN05421876_104202 [Kaistella jeonii]VEI97226.1 Uncharacterised protein [Kaistella jeonii]